MKRRDFLTKTSLASSLMLVPNFMKAFEGLAPAMQGYKKLVLIKKAIGKCIDKNFKLLVKKK